MDSMDISLLCASLSIDNHDAPVQLLDGNLMNDAKERLSLSLVGKILSNKMVNRDAFMRVIGKIWQVRHGVDIESIASNMFSFQFRDKFDLERVLSGGPWSFDNALIAMERPEGKGSIDSLNFYWADFWVQIHQVPLICMTKEIGRFLGGMIGQVLEVDGGASGDCVRKFLRVRVRVNISNSLKRCLRVDNLGDGAETIMILIYERLPSHCLKCGMVNHITSECTDNEPIPIVEGKENFPFGIWLRATGYPRKINFHHNRRGIFSSLVDPESNWKNYRGKGKAVVMHSAKAGIEENRYEDNTSNTGPIHQAKEADGLTGNGTEKELINCKELVGETSEMLVGESVEEKCDTSFLISGDSTFGPQLFIPDNSQHIEKEVFKAQVNPGRNVASSSEKSTVVSGGKRKLEAEVLNQVGTNKKSRLDEDIGLVNLEFEDGSGSSEKVTSIL
ncbi:hypothetical protein EZV62_001513 [Acer yangbiense]|uniref:DUF4283 domain-containing protein n=1 Tax=Acer yangbiense TaxID=1000413 RepID=A0A5C7IVM6_9ROSI|nr:hypothetical protein EZV62_001513 [Acer yangbiense]